MKRFFHRSIGLVLALTLILAQILIPMPLHANASEQTYSVSTQSTADCDVQDGVTLHCWNWSYKNIEANMAQIASLGYTAVQTSPIQPVKQTTAGSQTYDWWVFYQPVDFCIDNTGTNALGTKAEFESMCATAHEYGIKVIVDVVANHMADYNGSGKHPNIADYIENDSSCWHDLSTNISNYKDRYNITQYCLDGVPDLNTASDKVQSYVLNYLKECIDAGADGFRFDAAKHIETPDDTYCASDFWPTVINGAEAYASSTRGIDLYCYGELLYHPDDNSPSSLPDSAYTKYFSVTDNSWSNNVRNNIGNAGAYSYAYHKDATADQLVLWAESHDTYAGSENSDNVSNTNINKTWALVASRADAMALYLARPDSYTQTLGTASVTAWSWSEVAAVNHFHNAFIGQPEYVSNENGIAYVERGTSGVVLVNCNGSNSVNVTANVMADGTYTDQVSGNTFTVSGGRITGTIGSTGFAVVYNAVQCDHESHNTSGVCASCGINVGHTYNTSGVCSCGAVKPVDTTIYFVNSNNWSSVYIYYWSDSNTTMTTWPGDTMTKVEGTLYSATIPGDATKVIFHNNIDDSVSNKTADLTIQGNHYTMSTGAWTDYSTCTHSWGSGTVTKAATCTTAGVLTYTCANCGEVKTESIAAIGHSYDNGQVTTSATCTTNGVMTYTCANCSGTKTESISAIGHSYTNGICANCGESEPVVTMPDYYLFGWIDNKNYACEENSSDMGEYKLVNGTLTTTFSTNAYVAVKTADNTGWYMTNGWLGTDVTSAVLYSTSILGSNANKLYVPGGVKITFTLVDNGNDTFTLSYEEYVEGCNHSWKNATCTTPKTCILCGETEGKALGHSYNAVVTAPTCTVAGYTTHTCSVCGDSYTDSETSATGVHTYVNGTCTGCGNVFINPNSATLSLEGEVYYNIYFTMDDASSVKSVGLITFDTEPVEGTIWNADSVIPGAEYNSTTNQYTAHTMGVPAKKLGDDLYIRIYAEMEDGSYIYSRMFSYSAKTYAYKKLSSTATDPDLKNLVIAMLNYGAEAQLALNYKTDALVNADLTAEQKASIATYTSDMMASRTLADSVKAGNFANSGKFDYRSASMILDGALAINYRFIPTNTPDDGITLYYWDEATYNSVNVMTKDNATGHIDMVLDEGYYTAAYEGLAAKELDETIYVVAVYTSGGEEYTTEVIAYSLATYCNSASSKNTVYKPLSEATVVYGSYAKNYFANK